MISCMYSCRVKYHWFHSQGCINCTSSYLCWQHFMLSIVWWLLLWQRLKYAPSCCFFLLLFLMGKGINMTFNCYHVLEHENKWGYASPFPWNLDCKNDGAKKGCEWLEQMKRWKSWELETTSLEYQFTNGNWHQHNCVWKKKKMVLK